jgi:hypothetical protein
MEINGKKMFSYSVRIGVPNYPHKSISLMFNGKKKTVPFPIVTFSSKVKLTEEEVLKKFKGTEKILEINGKLIEKQ